MADVSTPTSAFQMKKVQWVDRLGSEPNIPGSIHITSSHTVFRSDGGGKEIWFLNALIQSIEKSPLNTNGTMMTIKCKNFLSLSILIGKDRDAQEIYESLMASSKLYNISGAFAFIHREKEKDASDGDWNRLNWEKEFERQELNENWKLSDFNRNYVYSDTYPEKLWFPANASTQVLIGSASFRSRGRLPALTYFYKPTGAVICRCAQPLAGFSARCVEDENLMEQIRNANPTSSAPVYVVDTRPRINAMANKMQGKGFEDARNYQNMQFHFFDIENIHVMRQSQQKLLDSCQKQLSVTEYLKAIDSAGWLKHLKALFDCGKFIADSLAIGNPCVVHCSDGWDRTSQTVSIAQILLDPFYQTIKGFQTLIDKDWLGFGFKFDDRCGHITTGNDESAKEISPIFTQFIDVIYQIMRVEPYVFEFNERLLFEINEHSYSCQFGTFLGNCDKDRTDLRVYQRTKSLWKYMENNINAYRNPFFKSGSLDINRIELPQSAFVVWSALYNRYDTGIQPREYIMDMASSVKEHNLLMERVVNGDNGAPQKVALQWQPLLNCEECASPNCRREFVSRFDRRQHCASCGFVFCSRCIKPMQKDKTINLCVRCNA
ncbi:unnamed protein product [Bursaphelenchus okinawaensis]|uniref:Myotubularin phosphatase domain-containing protein n=1 Tax=Bursaphelenchus okinawaensis TaxID=465554 RepID=A0A811KD08_9BILA|nr:unnamed protein product [Bursaphelenchus okinawaensis]CAG9100745.1 unnamed protein product [Bursaphelenchus okinawaensis]